MQTVTIAGQTYRSDNLTGAAIVLNAQTLARMAKDQFIQAVPPDKPPTASPEPQKPASGR